MNDRWSHLGVGQPIWLRAPFVFLGSFLLLAFVMDRQLLIYDESLILSAAMRMRAGEITHLNFYFVYGPAQPWLIAKLWSLGPRGFLMSRGYGLAIQAAIVTVAFILMRDRVSNGMRILYVVVLLIWLAALQNHLYPSFAVLLLALCSAIPLLTRTGQPPSPAGLVFAGLCAGFASLFRYDAGIPIVVAQIGYLFVSAVLINRQSGMPFITRAGILLASFAAVVGPIGIAYWQAGLADDWWRDVVESGATYYVQFRRLPYPNIVEMLRRPGLAGAYLTPTVILAAAVVLARRDGSNALSYLSDRNGFALLMGLLAVALYFKGIVRPGPLHFVMSNVPATLLLAAVVDVLWRQGRARRLIAGLLIFPGVIMPAHVFASMFGRAEWQPARLFGPWLAGAHSYNATCIACPPAFAGATVPESYARAAAYVRKHTLPTTRIFVTVRHTDRFVLNPVALYLLADRLPGTHWHIFDPGLQTRADVQRSMIVDLQQNKVAWILRDATDEHLREPNASALSSGVHLLDRWIETHYQPVARSGDVWIWRKIAPPDRR